ncbi:MAG: zeta toxin family protein [Myxococcota bacterium]|nr:zeta toxin family protein [Myxococcota bacterium]
MIGDKLVITDYHRQNGKKVATAILDLRSKHRRIIGATVAGESGSGKSETAATTAEYLGTQGLNVVILGQDDYFELPPKSNARKRREDITWVGPGEVHLDLMNAHLKDAKAGAKEIDKPLVYFEEDRISNEIVSLTGIDVIIAEGTYTTLLDAADLHAFIDATYHATLKHRKKRARDETEGDFIEQVLEIEHCIISSHKEKAHIILPPPP